MKKILKKIILRRMKRVNRRIAEIRKYRGLTQAQLAKMTGIRLELIKRFEKDKVFDLRTLVKLGLALKCHPVEIISAFDDPQTKNGRRIPWKPLIMKKKKKMRLIMPEMFS